jgi:hypothetical protein
MLLQQNVEPVSPFAQDSSGSREIPAAIVKRHPILNSLA